MPLPNPGATCRLTTPRQRLARAYPSAIGTAETSESATTYFSLRRRSHRRTSGISVVPGLPKIWRTPLASSVCSSSSATFNYGPPPVQTSWNGTRIQRLSITNHPEDPDEAVWLAVFTVRAQGARAAQRKEHRLRIRGRGSVAGREQDSEHESAWQGAGAADRPGYLPLRIGAGRALPRPSRRQAVAAC